MFNYQTQQDGEIIRLLLTLVGEKVFNMGGFGSGGGVGQPLNE